MTVEFELVLADYHPFEAGEILIIDAESGRELLGIGRKSSKWDVQTETFDTPSEAVSAARELGLTARLPDGYPGDSGVISALTTLIDALVVLVSIDLASGEVTERPAPPPITPEEFFAKRHPEP